MKRIKVMLTAVGVFAVVGGALAFKAKTYGAKKFCTTALAGGDQCTEFRNHCNFTTTSGTNVQYVQISGNSCGNNPDCTATGTPEG